VTRHQIRTLLALSSSRGDRAETRRQLSPGHPTYRQESGRLRRRGRYLLSSQRSGLGRGAEAPVLGAIALYLNIGLMFATLYGLIWYFIPNSFTNIPSGPHWQPDGTIVYFSFVTLTSTGFGDVTPLHPIVRTLANMEAIIGQLFPATLLARLITLELRGYRQRSRGQEFRLINDAQAPPERHSSGPAQLGRHVTAGGGANRRDPTRVLRGLGFGHQS